MVLSNAERAEVLIRALPYIQKYSNKIIVVKYGGNAMINEDLKKAVMGCVCYAFKHNADSHHGCSDPGPYLADGCSFRLVCKIECHRTYLSHIQQGAEYPHCDNDKEGLLLCRVRSVKDFLVFGRSLFTCEKVHSEPAAEDEHDNT